MARHKLTSGNSVADASTFPTAIVAPGINTLVLLFITNTRPLLPGGTPNPPTVTGNGLIWVQVQTVTTGNGNDRRLTCLRSMGPSPAIGPLSIDFGGQTQDYCAWSLFEYDGVDTSGSQGAAAVAQSATTTAPANSVAVNATLAASADPTRDVTVGAIMLDLFNNPMQPVTSGAGFTEIDQQTPTQTLGKGATLQTQDSTTARSTIGWTWSGGAEAAAIVLEVKAAPVTAPPGPGPTFPNPDEALVRRFEPVLHFHPQEIFFPVDAKRYVEHAALWASQAGFDDKNDWGGAPGDPFPREPMVTAGNLAAAAGEPGTFLGKPEFLLHSERDERFLELGGWKDKTQTHEPAVTSTSSNVYADRSAIDDRYHNEIDLHSSRFWYYAEVFDTDRLIRLASQVGAPDLGKIVARLRNPVLLCYYLFFPAHEQSMDNGYCPNIEAAEVGCHAGDWQCIAILLENDGGGTTPGNTPKFVGYTGARPAQVMIDGNLAYRPYQYDDENLTVMKVEAWRPASGMTANQPDVVGEHPRVYVARGAHSLYTTPGSHDVNTFPDGQNPQYCALFDNADAIPSGYDDGDPLGSFAGDAGVFLLKLGVGWLFGPWGAIAGLVAAGIEGKLPHPVGFDGLGTMDVPDLDQAPAGPGDGKTVRPVGLPIPNGGTDLQDWLAQEGLALGGRTYDFIVDRPNQVWWPSDDHQTGYDGRWGQHVTSDTLPRRSGPKFPPYWKMFLLALADGDASKLLDLNA